MSLPRITMTIPRALVSVLGCCFFTHLLVAKTPTRKARKKNAAVEQDAEPTPRSKATPAPEPSSSPKPQRDRESRQGSAAPNATVSPEQIVEFSGELSRVKKLIESALA